MHKFILAAAALAALSATPALADGEGSFQPTVTASGVGPVAGPVAAIGSSFQYNNAGNFGDSGMPAAGHPIALSGGKVTAGSFTYSMVSGQG
jgi:hypothetical protein